jgi:peroxiredoxin Q/BCP
MLLRVAALPLDQIAFPAQIEVRRGRRPARPELRRRRILAPMNSPKILACFFLALIATSTLAALKAGDTAPAFTAPASLAGKAFTYSLEKSLAKGPVVVYFYPSAYTEGCNIQAHDFSASYEKFTAAGASVVGVSLDDIGRLNAFSADPDYCAGKLAVASDGDGKIARAFGLKVAGAQKGATDTRGREIGHGFAERTTFIVKRDGTVAATVGGVSPEENVAKTLALVQQLSSGR